MRPLLSLKTLLRTPIKTLVTFILLTAISFALFSRVAEYTVTTREFERIVGSYRGVGTAQSAQPPEISTGNARMLIYDPLVLKELTKIAPAKANITSVYTPLSKADIEAITELPYITSTSTRYMTAGLSEDGFIRTDANEYYYNYASNLIIEATLKDIRQVINRGNYDLYLSECEIIAGDTSIKLDEPKINLTAFTTEILAEDVMFNVYSNSDDGMNRISTYCLERYDFDFFASLKKGERYLFSVKYNQRMINENINPTLWTADVISQSQWLSTIIPLDDKAANYLETEEFAALREYIDVVNNDIKTFDMVYTDNMNIIMRFAENKMCITEGRALNLKDTENKANICVVSAVFMKNNNLNLGDKITMRLGDKLFNQNASIGAVAGISKRLSDFDTVVTLEIVGVYEDLDSAHAQSSEPFMAYSQNTIFVPLSLLPVSADIENQPITPSEFSFAVDNAYDISAFLEEIAPLFEDMGLELNFSDGGWSTVETQSVLTGTLTLISIISLVLAIIIAIAFTVYLFIGRKKIDYAIMRALGTTKKIANRTLFIPLFAVAVIAVLSGSISALVYTQETIKQSFEIFAQSGRKVNTSIPLEVTVGCILGEIIFLCIFTMLGLWHIGKNSPLALLQSSGEVVRKEKTLSKNSPKVPIVIRLLSQPKLENIPRNYGAVKFVARHSFLRSRRAPFKAILTIALAAVFFGTIGQFAIMRHSYKSLFEAFEIKATFTDNLMLQKAFNIGETNYVAQSYFEFTELNAICNMKLSDSESEESDATFGGTETKIYLTNNLERFMNAAPDIKYRDGLDKSLFESDKYFCILGGELMDMLELEIGDSFNVTTKRVIDFSERKSNHASERKKIIKDYTTIYKIAGRLESADEKYKNAVFVPANNTILKMYEIEYNGSFCLNVAEYTLVDNYLVEDFRTYLEQESGLKAGFQNFIMETKELDGINFNLKLYYKLFPVIASALMLIGGLIPALMIIQSSKEAAIFRVLGTTKLRTRVILILQQLALCFFGLMLGILGIWFYNGSVVIAVIAGTINVCAVFYFSSCTAATLFSAANVTGSRILNLLQTKE